MTAQWLNVVLGVVGAVGTLANGLLVGWLTARNARQLASMTRAADRRKEFDGAGRQFLKAARQLRMSGNRTATSAETLDELSAAVAGIEYHRPELADGAIGEALAAAEHMVELRSRGGALGVSVTEAETVFHATLQRARAVLAAGVADAMA